MWFWCGRVGGSRGSFGGRLFKFVCGDLLGFLGDMGAWWWFAAGRFVELSVVRLERSMVDFLR
jgi:hypothetical protein